MSRFDPVSGDAIGWVFAEAYMPHSVIVHKGQSQSGQAVTNFIDRAVDGRFVDWLKEDGMRVGFVAYRADPQGRYLFLLFDRLAYWFVPAKVQPPELVRPSGVH